MPRQPHQYEISIDYFRGIAIFLITAFHLSTEYFERLSFPILNIDPGNLLCRGRIGLHIFFVISGYVFALSQKNNFYPLTLRGYLNYFMKRYLRVAPAYYVALMVYAMPFSKYFSFHDYFFHALFIHTFDVTSFFSIAPAFWYIGIQIQLYLIGPLLIKFIRKKPLPATCILLFIAILNNLLPTLLSQITIPNDAFKQNMFLARHSVLSYSFLFGFGILLYLKQSQIFHFLSKRFVLILLNGIIVFCLMVRTPTVIEYYNVTYYELIYIIIGSLIGLMIPYSVLKNKGRSSFLTLPFIKLGRYSYSIFLYNYFFLFKPPFVKGLMGYLFYFILIFAFGVGMYHLVEDPIGKITNNLFQKKANGMAQLK